WRPRPPGGRATSPARRPSRSTPRPAGSWCCAAIPFRAASNGTTLPVESATAGWTWRVGRNCARLSARSPPENDVGASTPAAVAGPGPAAVHRAAERLALELGVDEHRAAVLGAPLGGAVVGDRLRVAEADGDEPLAIDAVAHEPPGHRERALLGELLVVAL